MSKRDNQITIPLDQDTREQIDQKAEEKGLSRASYARMKLKEVIEQ